MRRRTALHALTGSVALLGGCLSTPDPAGFTTPVESSTSADTDSPTSDGPMLSIDSVETSTHALRLNDLGTSPAGSIRELSDYAEREQEVLPQAIESGYETSDPDQWLLKFVSSTSYFRRDGQYYRLTNPFPLYRITGETVEKESVEGEIASPDEYEEAVTHDGLVMTGLIRIALQEGYESTYLWDGIGEFLETYEAVDYHGDVVTLTLHQEEADPPYTVTATRISPTDLTDDAVWDATNASSEITLIVEAAGKTEGVYRVDDPPEELLDQLDAHQYVYLNGTFYTTYIEKRTDLPVSVDASVTDASLSDGAGIELSLTNESETTVGIMTGAPKPFGVLWFHPRGTPDERLILWTDAYEESSHVQTEGHTVKLINSIGLTMDLKPGETVTHEFRIDQTDLEPGQYVIENNVSVSLEESEGGTLPYRVVFSVSE